MFFLGHVMSKDGVSVDLAKIKAITNWSRPSTVMRCAVSRALQAIIVNLLKTSPA